MKRCPHCHVPLHDQAPYCPRCRRTPEPVPALTTMEVAVVIALAAFAGALVLWLVFTHPVS